MFINTRSGSFTRSALPVEAQLSSMYSIIATDFDGDKNPDLILGGNFYEAKPEAGINAGSYGCLLKGDGNGNFINQPINKSGLVIEGAVRDLKIIRRKNESLLLIARNNAAMLVKTIVKP